jgi:hypothetical protein
MSSREFRGGFASEEYFKVSIFSSILFKERDNEEIFDVFDACVQYSG